VWRMGEKVIGVLGGMGPEATLDFYGKLIRLTPARQDQDHLRVIIDSNPKVPDRTQAILHGGESPVPVLLSGAHALKRAGADFIVIPCVSAHFFLEELLRESPLPIISIFDATADEIKRVCPSAALAGLMGTTGTIGGGRFQAVLERAGLEVLVPDQEGQEKIMYAIYSVKDSQALERRLKGESLAQEVALSLVRRGAHLIVAGCTELPLVLKADGLPVPLVDPLVALARAAIREAGLEPL
jgi:aspartate racemase